MLGIYQRVRWWIARVKVWIEQVNPENTHMTEFQLLQLYWISSRLNASLSVGYTPLKRALFVLYLFNLRTVHRSTALDFFWGWHRRWYHFFSITLVQWLTQADDFLGPIFWTDTAFALLIYITEMRQWWQMGLNFRTRKKILNFI